MTEYKSFIQNQLQKMKAIASQFTSTKNSDNQNKRITVDSRTYELLENIAEAQQTTVGAVINHALGQYVKSRQGQSNLHATLERKEKNPLLYLDALSKNLHVERKENSA
ncbi:hypothetical protein [Ferviditalea candida]|uniref:Uncharacterized protein n=1 Tax=Ferviditalea candida TaxID=3108399 RepID=A0ABU5ZJT1_9BACL|nr:hypothetical protein [Paenibacillaceae bacterium T2]